MADHHNDISRQMRSEYNDLLELEDLESLLEEMDDGAESANLAQRLNEFGLRDREDLQARIVAMHTWLDMDD